MCASWVTKLTLYNKSNLKSNGLVNLSLHNVVDTSILTKRLEPNKYGHMLIWFVPPVTIFNMCSYINYEYTPNTNVIY
jgi:hypothetical protein